MQFEDDAIFKQLEQEEDIDLQNIREKRIAQLKREMAVKQHLYNTDHGKYIHYDNEKFVLKDTVAQKCVIHFCHKEFKRCKIIDKHLQSLAVKHFGTKFGKIDVEKAPFLVQKLQVKVLPCIVCFVDGISVDRVVGFDELGNKDDFMTSVLESRLAKSPVLTIAKNETANIRKTILGASLDYDSEDE